MKTRIINANIYTPKGDKAVKGEAMKNLEHMPQSEIMIEDDKITYVGPMRNEADADVDVKADEVIDAKNQVVLPGFIDSHTHLVFGGYRPEEFSWRLRGDTYMSIMERGGGIACTVEATRKASKEELKEKAEKYLDRMSEMGVTTVEAKSGYGLDKDTEIKQLEVIKELAEDSNRKVDIVATYLGGHAMPPKSDMTHEEYISMMINEMLPLVKEKELAKYCDVFCEKGVFSVDESRQLLQAAKDLGMGVKLHADEIVCTHGAELAAELGAQSADHLLHICDEGVKEMANSDTVATLLPLTAFTLREEFAPARKMIDEGCALALATDLNPGSCFSGSIPLTFALACIYMKMSVEEAITALTLNGAAAVGLADKKGSIEVGKDADLVILEAEHPSFLPYYTGMNAVCRTIARGKTVFNR